MRTERRKDFNIDIFIVLLNSVVFSNKSVNYNDQKSTWTFFDNLKNDVTCRNINPRQRCTTYVVIQLMGFFWCFFSFNRFQLLILLISKI